MEALIEKAPYIAAMLILVLGFLGFLTREAKRRDSFELARSSEYERLSTACHEHTKELNEKAIGAIDNSSRIIEANTKIIGAIERRMNGGR